MVGESNQLTLSMAAQDSYPSAGCEFSVYILDLCNELAMNDGEGHVYTQVPHVPTQH